MQLHDWPTLAGAGDHLCAIQAAPADRNYVLEYLLDWATTRRLALYYWSPAQRYIARVSSQRSSDDGSDALQLQPEKTLSNLPELSTSDRERITTLLEWLPRLEQPGLFVLEGAAPYLHDLAQHLKTLFFHFQQASHRQQYVALLGESVEPPLMLYPLLPVLEYPLPSRIAVREHVATQMQQLCHVPENTTSTEWLRPIVQACVGLPRGEIDAILRRSLAASNAVDSLDVTALQQQILDYKRHKLEGRGITLLAEPDVPTAAGLDKLDETMEQIRLLLEPEAELRGLRAPKSVLLWGIPGSGKSLAAKLSAKRIGGALIAADWNGLVGDSLQTSVENIDYLLSFADQIGNAILFFDEFDKAFSGWQSGDEKLGAIATRLLSWMNDHISPVVMMATINHLHMLPPEMIRRFEVIHFFGLPHAGALYDIFKLHLSQYFRYDFSHADWQTLLREYKGCTPAEVMKAVKAVARRRYFKDLSAGHPLAEMPWLSVEELLDERHNFVPDSQKRNVSNQIAAILNQADYALPVQGPDTSPFAEPSETLFGIEDTDRHADVNDHDKPYLQPAPLKRARPPIEDI